MNYGDAYPSALQQMSPPRVLISDHSSRIPLAIGPYHSPTGLPFVPFMPGTIGSTTIPCTTPASVLPPSPPPVLTTQLPHVFISDHSEVPAPLESRTLPSIDANINVPFIVGPSETKSVKIAVRRASEPSEVLSSSFTQSSPESEDKSKPRHTFQRHQSTTPTSNQWLKRVVVLLVCALVVGLAFKIGVELWKASYGDNDSTSQVVIDISFCTDQSLDASAAKCFLSTYCEKQRIMVPSSVEPSETPSSNQWLRKCAVVLNICGLIGWLAFKIGVKLWKASSSFGYQSVKQVVGHE